MKILYAAGLSPNDSSLYRLWALERLGHQVIPFNSYDYLPKSKLALKIVFRLSACPSVDRLNRLRAMGIATVSYMIDNPFGPRQDPGWRLYMKDIPHYDLHVVQRDKNIA